MLIRAIYTEGTAEAYGLKYHVPAVDKQLRWEDMKPHVRLVTRKELLPYLGEALLAKLETDYSQEEYDMPAHLSKIIGFLQASVANFAVCESIIANSVFLTPMGSIQYVDQEKAAIPADKGSSYLFQQQLFSNGNFWLNEAMKVMEAESDSFPEWKGSKAHQRCVNGIFAGVGAFERYFSIAKGLERVIYQIMQPTIIEGERRYLEPLTGKPLLEELREKLFNGEELIQEEEELVHHLRKGLASWASQLAAPYLGLGIQEGGLINIKYQGLRKSNASPNSLWGKGAEAFELFGTDIKNFLDKHVEKFPAYRDYGPYTPEEKKDPFNTQVNYKPDGSSANGVTIF